MRVKNLFYAIFALIQWTWGLPQTLLGLFLLLRYRKCPHEYKGGAVVTYHDGAFGGVSLGMFVFVNGKRPSAWLRDAEVHEYGHCMQSLLLGPLFLLVIGIPSALWCGMGACERYRREHAVSYYALYTESWANAWGAAATGLPRPTWADKVAESYAAKTAQSQTICNDSRAYAECVPRGSEENKTDDEKNDVGNAEFADGGKGNE